MHAEFDRVFERIDDHCTHGLNFDSLRPERDILLDYRNVLDRVYDTAAYALRLERVGAMLDCSGRPAELPEGDRRRRFMSLETVHRVVSKVPEAREPFWNVFKKIRVANPRAARHILAMAAIYAHVGPFARYVVAEIDRRIEAIDAAARSAEAHSATAALAQPEKTDSERYQSSLAP